MKLSVKSKALVFRDSFAPYFRAIRDAASNSVPGNHILDNRTGLSIDFC